MRTPKPLLIRRCGGIDFPGLTVSACAVGETRFEADGAGITIWADWEKQAVFKFRIKRLNEALLNTQV